MALESLEEGMTYTKSSRDTRTAMADSGQEVGMQEQIYCLKTENPPAYHIPWEGPEDTEKRDTSIVEKVRDDCAL